MNTVGRVKVEDLTGTRSFKYGVLGEVTEEDRIINSQNSSMRFVTTSRYDAWGRLLNMVYPDGEQLTYNYNPVGQLKSIYSSENIAYLKDVKYTFFDPDRADLQPVPIKINSLFTNVLRLLL